MLFVIRLEPLMRPSGEPLISVLIPDTSLRVQLWKRVIVALRNGREIVQTVVIPLHSLLNSPARQCPVPGKEECSQEEQEIFSVSRIHSVSDRGRHGDPLQQPAAGGESQPQLGLHVERAHALPPEGVLPARVLGEGEVQEQQTILPPRLNAISQGCGAPSPRGVH